jgi:hypothetical protein
VTRRKKRRRERMGRRFGLSHQLAAKSRKGRPDCFPTSR